MPRSAQKNSGFKLSKLQALLLAAIAIVLILVFSQQIPFTKNLSDKLPSSDRGGEFLSIEETLSLGGTCFTTPFQDDANDVEAAPDGQGRTTVPGKGEYDVGRVSVGRDNASLRSTWEFTLEGTGSDTDIWDTDHNISLQTYVDTAEDDEDERFLVIKEAKNSNWRGEIRSPSGEITDFNPKVTIEGNSVHFVFPWPEDKIVDGLAFVSNFYNKPETTMYSDTIWPPQDQRVAGHYTTFYCPK